MAENVKTMGIVIDDGRRRVPITNNYGDEVGVFYFNPTDMNIIERYNKLASTFDTIVEPLANAADSGDNAEGEEMNAQQIDALNEAKNRLYKAVNELFGGDMADAFFGSIHPFSPIEGKFYCEVVLEAVGNYISDQFKNETAKLNSRVEKYMGRFTKSKGKRK